MAIDISKLNSAANTQVRSKTQQGSQPQQGTSQVAAQSAATVKTDSVMLTPQAQQLQGAAAKMNALPDVDQKKIDQIKLAIAEGNYKIDPERLAANIVEFEKQMQDLNDY
ncbi:flagellar biosynthesis anti-sigma factor FlgM [Shewanella sp. NIFS-20-20]|uniref:flagellar biosynthesis anti-sigma factor FlgM n=1 Tax=Shewanella sp. NIFS-20-20 TaxID=2853806 RepID=UPI001C4620E7|nr:flagellar biosynthesis anti-sigma factor FlgM [Shewanella sp. NIFS-20-20]MBV7314767.1 flagellar biosynthesis anti-sigma factor FlgM [Shewanella sp. NIFS-20-20]